MKSGALLKPGEPGFGKRLVALTEATDRILHSMFHNDWETTLLQITKEVRDLLSAEACAIFLVDPLAPNDLILQASTTQRFGQEDRNRIKARRNGNDTRLTIHNVSGGGLTGNVAFTRRIRRLNFNELLEEEFRA